jgi:hypothetical protein
MKNVFQNKKQQVFLNQLEVFQNEKKMKKKQKKNTSLSDNEILSFNQDQNLKKQEKSFKE